MLNNIEGIILVYRQLLDGFDEINKMAIDGQQEANDIGRAQLVRIEDLSIQGEKLLELYKDVILEFESVIEPPRLNPHFQRLFDSNPSTARFKKGIN